MIPAQCKMARVALGIGVRDLAVMAKVAPATVSRLESGEELRERTVDAVRAALETAGITFLDNGDVSPGPGVALKQA